MAPDHKIAVGEVVEVEGRLFRLVRFTTQRWTPPIVEFRALEDELVKTEPDFYFPTKN